MKLPIHIRLILTALLMLPLPCNVFCQLSGTYTIGGNNPDYPSIDSAVNDLVGQGVSSPVVFNIRPGTYPGFTIPNIPNLVYPDSVIFQAETKDSTDVTITAPKETIYLNRTTGITLKWLTIEATGVNESIAVNFDWSFHCNILNCLISTPNSKGISSSDQAAVVIKHRVNSPYSSANVKYSYLLGKGNGFHLKGDFGITNIIGCQVNSSGKYALTAQWARKLKIEDNALAGEIDFFSVNGPSFSNNIVSGADISVEGFDLVENNQFFSTSPSSIWIEKAQTIRNNHFNGDTRVCAKLIEDNTFSKEVTVSRCDGTTFSGNSVLGDWRLSYSSYATISNNDFKSYTNLSFSDYTSLYNNLFYKRLFIGICNYPKVYYNNFSQEAWLMCGNPGRCPVEAKYNNFSQEVYVAYNSNMSHNNYYPSGGILDNYPFRYDPMYVDTSNLHSQNPLLIGKGSSVPWINTDIEGSQRPHDPTIGANEICLSSLNEFDSIGLTCGDGIKLKLCNTASVPNYIWSPSYGLDDSLLTSPTASPREDTRYFLLDSMGVAIDSILILVDEFVPEKIPDVSINCAQIALLSGNFSPSGLYKWEPTIGLSDSTIHNPFAMPDTTTTYIQEVTIPGCGVFRDTILVESDPLPIANAFVTPFELQCSFLNLSTCADSFQWDFGDGTPSNDTNPVHNYGAPGLYDGSLVAFNSYGSDTFQFSVDIIGTGASRDKDLKQKLNIYPNPSSGYLVISNIPNNSSETFYLKIFDLSGREVPCTAGDLTDGRMQVDIYGLASGVYLLEIIAGQHSSTHRLIKQ